MPHHVGLNRVPIAVQLGILKFLLLAVVQHKGPSDHGDDGKQVSHNASFLKRTSDLLGSVCTSVLASRRLRALWCSRSLRSFSATTSRPTSAYECACSLYTTSP